MNLQQLIIIAIGGALLIYSVFILPVIKSKKIDKTVNKALRIETKKKQIRFWQGDFVLPFPDTVFMQWVLLNLRRLYVLGGATLLKKVVFSCLGISGAVGVFLLLRGAAFYVAFLISAITVLSIFYIIVKRIEIKNIAEFKLQLPEAIDMIARALQAGIPLTKSFEDVSEYFNKPLGYEFSHISDQIKMGIPMRDVLEDSTKRMNIIEFRFFSVILKINQDAGGELAEVLKNLSASLRKREGMEKKLDALTSESRASAKILCLFPFFAMGGMYLTNPDIVDFLLNDKTGIIMTLYAISSMGIGVLIIRQLGKV